MNVFSNMRIGARLAFGFGVVLVLSIIIASIGVWQLHAVADASRKMMEVPVKKERLASDWNRNIAVAVVRTTAVSKSADASLAPFFAGAAAESAKSSTELLKQIEPLLSTEEEKDLFARVLDTRKKYTAGRDGIMKLKAEEKAEEAAKLLEQVFLPEAQNYQKQVGEFLGLQRKNLDEQSAQINAIEASSRNQLMLLAGLVVVFGFFCAWRLTAGITAPLRTAVDAARRVAGGDLTGTIEAQSKDECGELLTALKDMNDGIRNIVAEVRLGTDAISTASAQIAAGNLDLSSRTEEQAASIEETASSMEELTSTVRQNAENAAQANTLAASASDIATKGGQVVSEVVETMEDITSSSKKIVDIIGVIDGIAFQTNILALNAAVEAARAGEQGRGFAVVASEVRTLAQRSANAAKEIKSLIDDSVSKVSSGSALVARAGTTMEEIVDSVRRVTDIMSEITAASREQSTGIGQVNDAVAQMDQVTQQNAALVEEAAAAANSMQEQARNLANVVTAFNIGGEASSARLAPVSARKSGVDSLKAAPARPQLPSPNRTKAASASKTANDDWAQF
jgi:methyl-accepting chemotaxis protein